MKAYTDLKQSKKLAKILPLESADIWFVNGIYLIKTNKEPKDIQGVFSCWSLAALLDVIPKRIKDYNVLRTDISDNDFAIWYDEVGYGVNKDLPDIIMASAVDACCEMILKLHEFKIL